MKSIRGWLEKMVGEEVRVQLNIMLYGRKHGPRQVGVTQVRRKADKRKITALGNVHPLLPAPTTKGRKVS